MSEKEKYPEIRCEDFLEATARNLTLLKKLRCSAASEIQSPIQLQPRSSFPSRCGSAVCHTPVPYGEQICLCHCSKGEDRWIDIRLTLPQDRKIALWNLVGFWTQKTHSCWCQCVRFKTVLIPIKSRTRILLSEARAFSKQAAWRCLVAFGLYKLH